MPSLMAAQLLYFPKELAILNPELCRSKMAQLGQPLNIPSGWNRIQAPRRRMLPLCRFRSFILIKRNTGVRCGFTILFSQKFNFNSRLLWSMSSKHYLSIYFAHTTWQDSDIQSPWTPTNSNFFLASMANPVLLSSGWRAQLKMSWSRLVLTRQIGRRLTKLTFAACLLSFCRDTLFAARMARDLLWETEKSIKLDEFVAVSQT